MKLKSSNKFTITFITALLLLATILLCLNLTKKKKKKYPDPPETTVQKTDLDLVQITISEKSFKKIKKKRDKALSIGILEAEDSDFIPATISFNGTDFPAEIRLKGDWTIHLEGVKWSFRVKLKGDKTILGMRKFSLHHPNTRQYLNEWLYHKAIKSEDLMGLRYNFVEGKMNVKTSGNNYFSQDLGIYAVEETFDKRTIESNKRKESVILKFSEDYWWDEVKKSKSIADDYGLNYNQFMNYEMMTSAKYTILPFGESKVLADSTMFNYFKLAKNLLEDLRSNKILISEAFDSEKLAMDTALMNLFGAVHGSYAINSRYYYNPISSRLEPISFDGNSGVKLKEFKNFPYPGKSVDTTYMNDLANALQKVSNPSYLENLIKDNEKDIAYYEKILKTEFRPPLLRIDNLEFNQKIIREELKTIIEKFNLSNIKVVDSISEMEELDLLIEESTLLTDLSDRSLWISRETNLIPTEKVFDNKNVYRIERNGLSKPSFLRIGNVKVDKDNLNEISVIVKKGEKSDFFALRFQEIYPNRLDVVFDLKKGEVKDIFKKGDFTNEKAKIKKLSENWYLCSVRMISNTSKISIVFGPTSDEKSAFNWEGSTKTKVDTYIIPESFNIVEYK